MKALGTGDFTEKKVQYRGGELYAGFGTVWTKAAELNPENSLRFVGTIEEELKARWAAKDAEMAQRQEANDRLLKVLEMTRDRAGIK